MLYSSEMILYVIHPNMLTSLPGILVYWVVACQNVILFTSVLVKVLSIINYVFKVVTEGKYSPFTSTSVINCQYYPKVACTCRSRLCSRSTQVSQATNFYL